jgi:predicted transglutaminase-like cysteine proteinase
MKQVAFPIGLVVMLVALAAINPQPAAAFSVPAQQCESISSSLLGSSGQPERSKLDTLRMQQEASVIETPCSKSLAATATGIAISDPAMIVEPMIATDRPDIFGSTALAVSHTPLDAKWRAANGARLSLRSKPWASLIRSIADETQQDKLQTVNLWVNERVRFSSDRARSGSADQWSSAGETLRRGTGDCEDYAIAKMKLLQAAGISRADIYLVIARDLVRRADHAILAVRLRGQLVILDSSTDKILDARQVLDYRPIFSFGEKGAWVHGYAEPPVQIASAL